MQDDQQPSKPPGFPACPPCLPDLVMLTTNLTLSDGRSWKCGSIINDRDVIAQLYAARHAELTLHAERGQA